MTFQDWRQHIEYTVSTMGQWVGLLDEECVPLCELPEWLSLSAPKMRLGGASVEAQFAVRPDDRVVEELLAPRLASQDAEGRLEPHHGPARFLAVIREGERQVFAVTHATGNSGPSTITIKGVDLLNGLAMWPCPSTPVDWQNGAFTSWSTDASGVQYQRARRLARVRFGQHADGHTLVGPAVVVLRSIVQDSFDAVNALCGWSGDPHAVVSFEDSSDGPRVFVRTTDDFVWDTISKPAKDAGVSVSVDLWWPGDAPVLVRESRQSTRRVARTWDRPMQVVRIVMNDESN